MHLRLARTMPTMSWTLFLAAIGLLCCLIGLILAIGWKRPSPIKLGSKKRLPPGPPGILILGNLHMLGKLPHRTLHSLAKVYGPIMYIRLGLVPTIVVSSPLSAQRFLKDHDVIFASRPITQNGMYMAYGCKGLGFSPYGPYWQSVRKLCTLQLLTKTKIERFKSVRKEELGLLIESLRATANAHAIADLSSGVTTLTANMTCLMLFGRKYRDEDLDKKGFKALICEALKLAGAFNVADYLPLVGALDLQGLRQRMKACSKVFDDFLEKIIDDHVANREARQQKDLVDVMLSLMESEDTKLQINRTNIKAIVLDMLGGGMDTTANTVDWALAELIKHPQVMKKVQAELERMVGIDRMVDESDLAKLEYLDMVIKETFRLHPVAPLLVPHEAMEDCVVDSFHIPKKSRVIINAWAIGQDPNVWSDAEEFLPERFAGINIDVRGHDFQLIPFGSGRRGCPGMQLGLAMVGLIVAQLVHCFDWELPDGLLPNELDMEEEFGLTMPRAKHLLAIPTYRLQSGNLFVE